MGVKFHPTVELELIERIKRRRAEHRAAAELVATTIDSGPDPNPASVFLC